MKKVKKLEENGLYLISGKAVAKNAFFEKRFDVELAHRYINRYLSGMMEIQDYLFAPEGWMLIVKTKNSDCIIDSYLKLRSRSKKAKEEHIKTKASEMISEHIRYFLSKLVKVMNIRSNRTGTKVHRVFERYVFESKEECLDCMKRMRGESLKMCNQVDDYKADREDYEELAEWVGKGDIILCSKAEIKKKKGGSELPYLIHLQRVANDVLGKIIKFTFFCQNQKISTSKSSTPPNST